MCEGTLKKLVTYCGYLNVTYFVAIFARSIELPVLTHLSSKLVNIRGRGSEFVVDLDVFNFLLQRLLLLDVLGLLLLRDKCRGGLEVGHCLGVELQALFGVVSFLNFNRTGLRYISFLRTIGIEFDTAWSGIKGTTSWGVYLRLLIVGLVFISGLEVGWLVAATIISGVTASELNEALGLRLDVKVILLGGNTLRGFCD